MKQAEFTQVWGICYFHIPVIFERILLLTIMPPTSVCLPTTPLPCLIEIKIQWRSTNMNNNFECRSSSFLWLSRVFYSNQNYQKKPVLPISPRWQNLFLSLPVQFPSLKPSQPMYYGAILQSHILAPSLKEANCQWIQNLWRANISVSNITMKQWVQYFILPFLKWESKPVFVSKGHPVPAHGILIICRNYQTEEISWSGYAP